jgi:hypothetical protein
MESGATALKPHNASTQEKRSRARTKKTGHLDVRGTRSPYRFNESLVAQLVEQLGLTAELEFNR